MSSPLPAKAPTEVVERRWTVPVDTDDGVASVAVSASGVTATGTVENDDVVLAVSGGTAATTGTITATVTTSRGRTLVETLYIPVIASPSQIADTARSYINFALRKLVGIGNDPEAAELSDALERLEGLIASWRTGGADIGATMPLTANTVIYCPDWAVSALRYNLLVECSSIYGVDAQPSPIEIGEARRGLQLVKHKCLPSERGTGAYY